MAYDRGPVQARERIGVLVIRAWLEEGTDADRLRARITRTSDVTQPAVEAVSISEVEIVEIVREWLGELAQPA
jgi:hypothetical protein